VPKAIMIATVLSGFIYFALSRVSPLVFPSNAFDDPDIGSVDVMPATGGNFLDIFSTAAYVAGCIGSALTSQASVSRILYAMGRDGALPRKIFGHVSVRFATPTFAILVVFSAVNLSVITHYFIDQNEKNVLDMKE
jgi:amino acid transporter